ncbi:hypothetical protein ACIRQF_30180 [Streptomyces sp. NPDC101191]|uniref:hypothetical protein n=1 Tax=Streptomyces sp. NPDC101191 TaxID=3366126 RepID=UPI0038292ECE
MDKPDQPNPARAVEARIAARDAAPSPNRFLTNDAGVPLLCAYIPGHAHRGVYATGRLPAGPMGTVAACDDCCEACAQDADTEADEIEASMGLREPATHVDDQNPTDAYEVTVFRTEMITYALTAVSAQDAEERYLLDGEETGSKTVELRVDSVTRQQRQEPTRPV